ncbi:MAG: tRNA (adenosine(37)-N6)-threonylcarbamoyltransferase complex dimerization subunit type 1 TsaB [Peptoniphilaceae bacterium]|uniref:tRNA (adenosine(37)-N6)-threonylcarbamoyltransferase complex dimerization subunit type 1 TsaB n=1 Tax=Parvimonas sp. TaxID=1944660 RepID=UPI002A74BAD5|nr:tRNA (adenosine(37)-N6)-threonylcarbamoyltransferase complex dimerization subunit type 1 TsaB [Parvimonas sp.]MDD7765391.1 tRNA (adenosine(37)-N6)-threonylcarbamoyltransferase complex dimerization subunit type 1 TsaB [Peptoniphilaceae bacterium]MDY3050657.1 tRNA (adenosine(37)-N6)-threonylcarbamoyltransferase complex dimerization subunit type 1 TsaB [Parvimonas sp.]
MKILAIDTSTTHSCCSVMENDYIVGEFSINQSMSHNEILLDMVQEMLSKLNIDISEIDLYVAVTGPGSFTGIRIGVTTAKALAMALNKPIVSVNTLEAMSFGVFSENKKIPIIDARGGRVYYGVYKGYDNCEIEKPDLMDIDELLMKFDNSKEEIIFTGDAVKLYEKRILKNTNFKVTSPNLNSCISRNACVIGKEKFKKNILADCYTLSPEYVRQSQAQRDLEKREEQK